MPSTDNIYVDKEEFAMQRTFLYALTIRADTPVEVKAHLETIETNLAKMAGVKSVFEQAKELGKTKI